MDKAASTGHSDRCRIVVDTCCDFSPEVAANLDVDILGFPFIIDGEERTDDIWSSITPKEFYDRMRAGGIDYDQLGVTLGMQPASARSAVHRLRKRFRELFRDEVSSTVADPAEVDDEMRAVIAALGSD